MKYPDDFKPFHGVLCNERDINCLVEYALKEKDDFAISATGNILVEKHLGYVSVYQCIGEVKI